MIIQGVGLHWIYAVRHTIFLSILLPQQFCGVNDPQDMMIDEKMPVAARPRTREFPIYAAYADSLQRCDITQKTAQTRCGIKSSTRSTSASQKASIYAPCSVSAKMQPICEI